MLQLGRNHGDDRFYNAVKARRSHQSYNHNHHNRHYQQSQRSRSNGAAGVSPASLPPAKPASAFVDSRELESRAGIEEASSKAAPAPPPATFPVARSCNLDRFLESTAPSVRAQYMPKSRMKGWRICDELRPYFFLSDLWESFSEWSAYGAGVPLVLNRSDSVVQYYVPYLSGIQLYVESNSASSNSRPSSEESDGDFYRDSSSEGSSDYEHEKGLKYSRSFNPNHGITASGLRLDRLSLREKLLHQEDESSSDECDLANSQGRLLFEFLEHDPPFIREPLADKISDLARRFPALRTLRSCDLLPSSWMSVAWYPIYRIPTGPTLKDLDACFLTFHHLSTSTKNGVSVSGPIMTCPQTTNGVPRMSLRSFALASYKFKSSIWTPNGGPELQTASTLLQAADKLLQDLNVNHPDYRFFTTHGGYRR